jgi:Uma2 family endonuclease
MVIGERFYSAEDLWEMSHSEEYVGARLELSAGRLIVMSPAGWKHGGIASTLNRFVGDFVADHNLGMTTAAETGYILYKNPDPNGKDTVRAPDVGFVAAARIPANLPDGYVPFAPDLAIEVISPGDDADEVDQKVREYLKYGTLAVWLFYPKTRSAAVYTPTSYRPIESDGVIDGGAILPGFKVKLTDIFPK